MALESIWELCSFLWVRHDCAFQACWSWQIRQGCVHEDCENWISTIWFESRVWKWLTFTSEDTVNTETTRAPGTQEIESSWIKYGLKFTQTWNTDNTSPQKTKFHAHWSWPSIQPFCLTLKKKKSYTQGRIQVGEYIPRLRCSFSHLRAFHLGCPVGGLCWLTFY